jgi:hypothetical protein
MVGLAEVYGKVSVAMGRFEEEALFCNRLDKLDLPKDVVGVALYHEQSRSKGGLRFLVLGSAGQAKVHEIAADLRNPWRKDLGDVKLQTATPVKAFTAMTMQDADTLITAADGQVITFGRDGANWKESGRWSDGFGSKIRLAINEGRLAVADTEKNRAILYSLTDHRKLAEARVTTPTEVALNGNFLVVYDSAGQRLMKFSVQTGK